MFFFYTYIYFPSSPVQEVTLGRVGVRAQLSVVGLGSREEEDRIVQRCTFTPGELLGVFPQTAACRCGAATRHYP